MALPAFVLAILGMRAVRAERVEREQQLRDRQTQTARIAGIAIDTAFAEVERDAPTGRDPDVHPFTFDRSGRLLFPRDRVFTGPGEQIVWPEEIEMRIEEARAAEAQGRRDEAAKLYAAITGMEPRLRAWSRFASQRVRDAAVVPRDEPGADQVTPGGLPFALFAATQAEPARVPSARDVLGRTRARLRAGTWLLGIDERRFYDRTLTDLLGDGARDERLELLAAVGRALENAPLQRGASTRHFDRVDGRPLLLLLSPADESPTTRRGAAVAAAALDRLLTRVARQTALTQLGRVRIADGRGRTVWGSEFRSEPARATPLPAVSGWTLAFEPGKPQWFDRRTILWIGFIAVLVATMLVSLAGTMRVIRRETQLAQMQNDFIAGVSHDFKSPITAIRLLLERMAGGRIASPSSLGEYRSAAERELTRLERHVNRLLEVQKIEAGGRRYEMAPAAVPEVVDAAIAELTTEAEAKRLTIAHEARDVPTVAIDRGAITDAIANVIGNAIKYSPEGTRIDVTTRVEEGRVLIEVRDEGIGIEPEEIGRVFDRFYRGDGTGTNGTGLGLALVKATVQAHGGEVGVSSVPGKGSRFTISLPLRG